jgi:hypothetical protein
LKIPVVTIFPCQVTSLGNPTLTDNIFMTLQPFDYADDSNGNSAH